MVLAWCNNIVLAAAYSTFDMQQIVDSTSKMEQIVGHNVDKMQKPIWDTSKRVNVPCVLVNACKKPAVKTTKFPPLESGWDLLTSTAMNDKGWIPDGTLTEQLQQCTESLTDDDWLDTWPMHSLEPIVHSIEPVVESLGVPLGSIVLENVARNSGNSASSIFGQESSSSYHKILNKFPKLEQKLFWGLIAFSIFMFTLPRELTRRLERYTRHQLVVFAVFLYFDDDGLPRIDFPEYIPDGLVERLQSIVKSPERLVDRVQSIVKSPEGLVERLQHIPEGLVERLQQIVELVKSARQLRLEMYDIETSKQKEEAMQQLQDENQQQKEAMQQSELKSTHSKVMKQLMQKVHQQAIQQKTEKMQQLQAANQQQEEAMQQLEDEKNEVHRWRKLVKCVLVFSGKKTSIEINTCRHINIYNIMQFWGYKVLRWIFCLVAVKIFFILFSFN